VGGVIAWPSTQNGQVMPWLLGATFFLALIAWIFTRRSTQPVSSRRSALLAAYSVITFSAATFESGTAPRYSYAPSLFLLSAILVLVPLRERAVVIALLVLAVVWLPSLPATDYRVHGPAWSAAITRATATCRHAAVANLPIGPYIIGHHAWGKLVVPCSAL
jgi:hypothetical protein